MNIQNNKVLILGAGEVQKDLIECCKNLDIQTHTCGNILKKNVIKTADFSTLIDITNIDEVLDYVENNSIDIIYSIGSDIALFISSYISENKSLPHFVSSETVAVCNNKYKMRSIFSKIKKLNVKFQKIDSLKEKIILNFPFIMKPVDSWGQRGVFLISNIREFNNNFYKSIKFSKTKCLILEEYIEGSEVSVNVYMVNGEITFSIITDRISLPLDSKGIVHKHQIPSKLSSTVRKKINMLVKAALNVLNISNGPVYFQIKLKKDIPKIIEIAPRLDGCHLWRLIKYYTSIDLIDITFKHLLGKKPNFPYLPKVINSKLKLEFLFDYPKTFVDQNKFIFLKKYEYLEWYYEQSEKILPLNEVYEKIGYYIAKEMKD